MESHDYLIYYISTGGNGGRLEGNMSLTRGSVIRFDEIETLRSFITGELVGDFRADQIFNSGGKIVIANIMKL